MLLRQFTTELNADPDLKHDRRLIAIPFKRAMFILMFMLIPCLMFFLSDKQPTICGGGSASEHDKRRCMKYDAASDQWSFVATNAVGGG